MAHLNKAALIAQALQVKNRVDFVRTDPAVRKTWNVAAKDVVTAARSVTEAVRETSSAWYRSGDPHRADSARRRNDGSRGSVGFLAPVGP